MRSTLTGIGVADLLMNHPSTLSAHFLAEDTPKKLVPSPFAEMGATLYFRWKEWLARAE